MHFECGGVSIDFVEEDFCIVVVRKQISNCKVPGSSLRQRALCAISKGKS